MAFTRTASGVCIANLHATNDRPELAAADVLRGGEAATEWAGDSPLLFGGDLNLRPAEDPAVFEELRERFDLTGATGPARDRPPALSAASRSSRPPAPWPAELRELRAGGRALRLSDHAPVQARFASR